MKNIKTIVLRNGTEFMADVLEEKDHTLTFKYGMTCMLGNFEKDETYTLRPFNWPVNADVSVPLTINMDDILVMADVRPEALTVYNNYKRAIEEHDNMTEMPRNEE